MISATTVAAQRLFLPRTGRETLLVLLAVALLPFFFVGSISWLATDVGRALANLGHIPFFALVTLAIRSRFSLRKPRAWLAATAFIFALSVVIEFTQSQVGRTASGHDVLRNLIGAWLVLFWAQPGDQKAWAGLLSAGALLAFELFLFSSVALTYHRLVNQLPVLANLEGAAAVQRWTALESELEKSPLVVSEGEFALKVKLSPAEFSGTSLKQLAHDWSGYRRLRFDLYNPQSGAVSMTLRIHDGRHEFGANSWQYDDRFNHRIEVEPGWNHYSLELDQVEKAPDGRRMDMTLIKELRLFATKLDEAAVIYADNFRFEK